MKEDIMYLHSINTFACHDNEVYIRAVNNRGVDTLLVIPADEVLEWIDISYVREQVIKHYKNINKEDVIDEVREQIIETYKKKVEHPDELALEDVDKVIENIEKHWEPDKEWEKGVIAKLPHEIDEEEIEYSCCGDEITGIYEDIQICPTCKEHL